MVNSTNFYQLTYEQQADALLSNATFLLSRFEDSFIVDLFELDDLLVEVFYQKESEELVSVMAYNSSEKLRTLTRGVNLTPKLTIKKEPAHYNPISDYYA